ncbi:MAG: hypothetical protein ACFFCZ_11415 [Promethearchaeota archaeon]
MKAFMVLVIVCLLIGGVGAAYGLQDGQFTIADFWLEGGKISYEYYSNLDVGGMLPEPEIFSEGFYSFQGNTTEGNLQFLNNETFDPIYLLFAASRFRLGQTEHNSLYGELEKGDVIKYEFSITNGVVDFYIWTEEQYNQWINENTTTALKIVDEVSRASGTVQIPSNGTYYFTWVNWGHVYDLDSVIVYTVLNYQIQLEPYSADVEIDPIALKDEEDRLVDVFGMDTTEWGIDTSVLLEIAEQDVYFSIIREEDLTITYNGNSTAIPCWVLEKENYDDIYSEDPLLSLTGDYTLWKSKYSGVTLKTIYDAKVYDNEDTLIGTFYRDYSVQSASNVILMPVFTISFSMTDILVVSITTFTILALLKKYKFRSREP